jgi:phthalate 4,5-dioxygenase oxygenase subunit
MLRKEVNDLLTQTGPGTPMGEMFRRYWIPALLARELPDNDCPPVRVKLLSERMIAFRDSEGRYGLMDEFCAHRGVSLWFGRNEEGGLRCPYHGWKYDVTGQCIEVPSEPAESDFCNKIKLKSYPLVKIGDILWTYMGPAELQPPLPEFEFALVPTEQCFTSKRLQYSNWLQALEGGIDSSHVPWLHKAALASDPLVQNPLGSRYTLSDTSPHFEVTDHPGGLYIGVRRDTNSDHYYWRITPWVMPCFTAVPPRGDHPIQGHLWVPIDDENCWAWSYSYHPSRPLTQEERAAMEAGKGVHCEYVPGTFIPKANKSNDYLIDRQAQKEGRTYSGVDGLAMQDASLQESMSPIVDRTKENLVGTDNGIIMARQRLLRAAKALAEKGTPPPGTKPEEQRVRSAAVLLPNDQVFNDALEEHLRAKLGQPHATV